MEATTVAPQVGFSSSTISVWTEGPRKFLDITDDVVSHVKASGVDSGLAVVSSRHTTAAIVVNEHEPELLKDLDTFLARIAPDHHEYGHNLVPCGPDEGPNAHSHCQALLLNTSVSLPVIGGELGAGRFQRVFVLELDKPRPRHVTVTVLGV